MVRKNDIFFVGWVLLCGETYFEFRKKTLFLHDYANKAKVKSEKYKKLITLWEEHLSIARRER